MVGRRRRYSKPNRTLTEEIAEKVAAGMPCELAARTTGIAMSTYRSWKKRGDADGTGIYWDFFQAMEEAEAQSVNALVGIIWETANKGGQVVEIIEDYGPDGLLRGKRVTRRRMPKDWKAAERLLQIRFPEAFNRQYVHHAGDKGVTVNLVFDDGVGSDDPPPPIVYTEQDQEGADDAADNA